MGIMNSSNSASEVSDRNYATHVLLNVYDLTPLNNYMYWFGLGIFHSGIEVHGMEYGFGAHDFPTSGVFEVDPKSCPGFIYRCSISLGRINIPPSEFRTFMENMAAEYHGDTYHLISKNCNHFTDDISLRLTGKRIPGWVNRLAHLVNCNTFVVDLAVTVKTLWLYWLLGVYSVLCHLASSEGKYLRAVCSCLLPESLQVTTVKQLPEYHGCSGEEDGSESFSTTTPREPTESDEADQDKHLLSPSTGGGEVAFIKEVQR
ncbi:hypothetical protein HHK36_006093 [Tetracentron sinense]|uniref:PPPDE domain-containing protein n=1 Tax=Tetracentron sinense TaxID=13715 RepID=A0A834ZR83_TETSI|nr:hypothetical protein HHK36_006093 [Tetracentron sinense]